MSMKKEIFNSLEEIQKKYPQREIGLAQDISNKKFGRLTALYRANITKSGNACWACKCDCGKYILVIASSLLRGNTKSCGCLHKETAAESGRKNLKNIIGQKFGRLTVLERVLDTDKPRPIYKCQCDCGNIVNVWETSLVRGSTVSCGCYQKELISNRSKKDITGLQSGYLIALEPTDKTDGSTSIIWKCKCTRCGNITYKRSSRLIAQEVQSCGCLNSLGEEKIRKYLNSQNINFKSEYSFEDLKLIHRLRFDFGLLDQNDQLLALIEFQGQQHYRFNSTTDFGKQQREITDSMKKEYCLQHKIPLYEIRYDEDIEKRLQEILNIIYK